MSNTEEPRDGPGSAACAVYAAQTLAGIWRKGRRRKDHFLSFPGCLPSGSRPHYVLLSLLLPSSSHEQPEVH